MRFTLLALAVAPLAAYQLPSVAALSRSSSSVQQRPRFAAASMEAEAPEEVKAPSAYIEFIVGVPEPVVPDVSLTRSRDGTTGVATFTFDNPTFLSAASEALGETTGMYLKVCAAAAALATAWPY